METTTTIKVLASQAWENLEPPLPSPGGTLHVIVDIDGTGKRAHLIKKHPQGINPKILLIEIVVEESSESLKNPQHLSYTEILESLHQYSEISVLFDGQLLAEIKKIRVVH
ncbi:MAG: hypothetical protein RL641_261 [Candidatus Parcubacteria bacterium]|jgi:hypothetical protein